MRRVTGWVIRYGDREHALTEGTHLVGRDEGCHIRLDDELVSRQHASFVVGAEGVSVCDLGSRNGVFLKYRRLFPNEMVRLFHGDTCLIGSTNFILLRARTRRLDTMQVRVADVTGHRTPERTDGASLISHFLADADRSLAEGDVDRFATATHLLLEALGVALPEGRSDDAALAAATRHALKLAELRGLEWVDQLLALYDALLLAPSIEMVTSMQRLFRENDWRCPRLDRYVERIGPVLDDAGPRGRALLGQLESLRRLQR